MAIGEVAAKSCNESTYTYIYISIFSTPASRVYSHCVRDYVYC